MDELLKISVEKHLIQAEIINQLEKIRELKSLNKTDLANILNVNKSFISQLYSGAKFFNIEHLARIQRGLDVNIEFIFKDRELK